MEIRVRRSLAPLLIIGLLASAVGFFVSAAGHDVGGFLIAAGFLMIAGTAGLEFLWRRRARHL
jgi:hypothetical protein